jgi:hypothetical protein
MTAIIVRGFIKVNDTYLNISQITSLTPTEEGKTIIRTNDEFYKKFTVDMTIINLANAILQSQTYEGLV